MVNWRRLKITKRFRNLDPSKQKRIINAALTEFAEKGFKRASTNTIVKHADIGKGMLFYYFNSKKDLYFYLIDYTLDIIETKYLQLIDKTERDLFERLKRMAETKLEFIRKYPNAMNFLARITFHDANQIDAKTSSKIERLQHIGYEKIYSNIDFSLFRDDIDHEKAFQIIRWSFDGYEEELTFRLRDKDIRTLDYDPYWEEFYEYVDTMRKGFYK